MAILVNINDLINQRVVESNRIEFKADYNPEPITVRITENSMEITSFPGLDRSITDEKIEAYDIRARIYRNRRIDDFLKELHLIEGRNTGFPNALAALEQNGSERFTIDMNPDRDYVSVTIPVHSYFLKKKTKDQKEEAYLTMILEYLSDKPMTLTDLAKSMGYKGITKKLKNSIEKLCNRKKIKIVISNRVIKYKK